MDPDKKDPRYWWKRLTEATVQAGPWVALVANSITVLRGIQGK
ncbi:hypothetical protein [Streptomyces goshikiensis]